jgi:hypothetical protein
LLNNGKKLGIVFFPMDTIQACGQTFTPEMIDRINALVASEPEWSRNELARQVCEWLNWRNFLGGWKILNCRVALGRLAEKGLIRLPKKGVFRAYGGLFKRRELPPPVIVETSVEKLKPIFYS